MSEQTENIDTNELPKTYDPTGIESKWYQTWEDSKSFKPVPNNCLLYTSPSPRDKRQSRMPSSA